MWVATCFCGYENRRKVVDTARCSHCGGFIARAEWKYIKDNEGKEGDKETKKRN